jgi:hypothetical protein
MTGLTRASIRDRSAHHCCHEWKESLVPSVGKATSKMRWQMADLSGWCVLFESFRVTIGRERAEGEHTIVSNGSEFAQGS